MTALQAVPAAEDIAPARGIDIDIEPVLAQLDSELVALGPVKRRLR